MKDLLYLPFHIGAKRRSTNRCPKRRPEVCQRVLETFVGVQIAPKTYPNDPEILLVCTRFRSQIAAAVAA
jgi:hypothetical protein